jgi:hypothetical protein
VATDLDGTVLYSARAAGQGVDATAMVAVDAAGPGYMAPAASAGWQRLAAADVLVPVTTRSVPQYLRLRLPGPPPRHAIASNGAQLLIDGVPDPAWHRAVRARLRGSAVDFAVVWRQATAWHAAQAFRMLRAVDDCFVYLTVAAREAWLPEFVAAADAWAAPRGWRASLQGRKLYLVPAALDKAAAVADLAARLQPDRVVAGGDSLLDAGMLRAASAAIRPAHGELHATGFVSTNCAVTAAAGITAGEEIVSWYAGHARITGYACDQQDTERGAR